MSLYWLEGRGAALAGDMVDAEHLLAAVRDEMIARRFLPEATLSTIDLGLVWSPTGRGGEVGGLVEELAAVFAGSPGFDLALETLSPFAEDAPGGQLDREIWSCVSPALRMAFRHQGVPLRPVPFV